MFKRFIFFFIAIFVISNVSLFNDLPVFAVESDSSMEKSVISETASNTNDAIESLREKLKTDKKIRVIVGLSNGSQMPDEIEDINTINRVQQRLISSLEMVTELSEDEVKKFNTIPFIVLSVTEEGFEHLLQNPDVISIEEDIPIPFTMVESNGVIGSNTAWNLGFTGKGQTVAVLDTGVDKNHSFLKGKVVSEACYSSTNSFNNSTSLCPGGKDSTAAGSALDCNTSISGCGHGTHVAGTVAGREMTHAGKKISGVAKNANIIAIQVFSKFPKQYGGYEVRTYNSDQLLGLERVFELKNQYNISSVNMSLGGGRHYNHCDSQETGGYGRKLIIDNLTNAGIAVVIASGNDSYTNSVSAPACISSAISVGATTKYDTVAKFSNSAVILDLLAPGEYITSSVPGNMFGVKSGTSMAAPHVAGAWAVLKEAKPNATVDEVLTYFQNNGKGIKDNRNSITKPRIDLKNIGKFSSKKITSLESEPSKMVLNQGKTQQLKINANYSDDTNKDVTAEATYTSSNTKRATVSKEGLISIPTDATNGTVGIIAKYGNHSITISVTVEPELSKLEFNQSKILLELGKTASFKLSATYTDKITKDITSLASYEIVNGQNQSVKDQIFISNGTLKSLSTTVKGNYTLIASYQDKEVRTTVEVKPVLTNLTAESQKLVLNPGKTQQLKISASFSDNSSENVTSQATYTSSNSKRATVSEGGLVTIPAGATNGTVNITAKYGNSTVVVSVTVEPELTNIELDQSTVLLELGKTSRIKLTATYTDGKKKDITSLASYEIVNEQNQPVKDQISISKGTLKALSTAEKRNYTLIASYQDKEVRTIVEVKPVLTKLTAESQKLVLNPGKTQQLKISASFSDNSSEDVTSQATYTSSNTKRATVSEGGLVTIPAGATNGTVNITTKYGNRTLVISVTVEPELTNIELDQFTVLLELGKTARIKLTATYTDGKKKDITSLASYEIVNEQNQPAGDQISISKGTLKALSTAEKRNYTLIASYQDKEVRATVEVKPVLTKLTAEPHKIVLNPEKTQQLEILASFSDNSNENVTSQATYTSSNTKRATVSEGGLVTIPAGATNGTVNITAKYGNRTLVISVTVEPELTNIELDQSTVLLELGKTARIKLTATYTDGKKKDITSLASYEIVNDQNQPVNDQISISKGTLKALTTAEKGNYTLIASYQDKEIRATIEVKPVLTKLTVESQKITLNPGNTRQLQILANYSDNSSEDVTSQAIYKSSNTKRVIVSEGGLITIPDGATNGTVSISVKYGGRSIAISAIVM